MSQNFNFMNIFTKSAVSIGKIIVAFFLLLLNYQLFSQKDLGAIYLGIELLVFFTLPTIFVVYFKNKFIAKHPGFVKIWKFLRVIYVLILILLALALAVGFYRLYVKDKTQKAIDIINSTKITLDDVMGKNLPPQPDQKINDSTIAGIDANKNGIRDDVELAIFKKYPDSAKIRAAELQYAQSLQLELTQVFNSDTLVSIMQKKDLAYQCLGSIAKNESSNAKDMLAVLDQLDKEVSGLALSTDLRKKQYSDEYEKYMKGYASLLGHKCDIEPSSLPN